LNLPGMLLIEAEDQRRLSANSGGVAHACGALARARALN
jgi:hypothetical protein